MTDVVFFVSAHPDDALLFRGDILYGDLHTPKVKVVHIIVTAGDAGRTNGWWQAREAGALEALQVTLSPNGVANTHVTVNGRSLQRYSAPEWVSYCMRLPDGNVDNSGFPSTGRRTLGKLQSRAITSISAVDGSASYNGWGSFTATLKAIFDKERQGMANVRPWVNASDYDHGRNPNDHADHYAVGDALRSFVNTGYNRAWWVSYDVGGRPANLERWDLDSKRYLFYAHSYAIEDQIGEPPNDGEWDEWGPKRYEHLETA